jgi:hypothetical protein
MTSLEEKYEQLAQNHLEQGIFCRAMVDQFKKIDLTGLTEDQIQFIEEVIDAHTRWELEHLEHHAKFVTRSMGYTRDAVAT